METKIPTSNFLELTIKFSEFLNAGVLVVMAKILLTFAQMLLITEGALRRHMTNDNNPILSHPPTYSIENDLS